LPLSGLTTLPVGSVKEQQHIHIKPTETKLVS